MTIPFDNSYLALGDLFYSRQLPTPVKKPSLIRLNNGLAELLGLNPEKLRSVDYVDVLAGNAIPQGAEPIATVYAGHQFGSWNPQLGDGRAILLGEVVATDGQRYDIQLKGAGQTPYSRMGDGRSPLGPVLREYIVSEAMASLGVPTTRSLAAVATGEYVFREGAQPGAVLTRVARSHIRVGTFQYFAARGDHAVVRQLADHVIDRHYPEARNSSNPYLTLLSAVIERQASLIAQWQSLGFIHGVMNTDNMLISGDTVDYGPCAFMDSFDPDTVYSSIDAQGRYAYKNQPPIAQWNLLWLAQSLLPLLAESEEEGIDLAQAAINKFSDLYEQAWLTEMLPKLGFSSGIPAGEELIIEMLDLMATHKLDFTLTFRALADSLSEGRDNPQSVDAILTLPEGFSPWLGRWQDEFQQAGASRQLAQQLMYQHNPVFIPRNHLVEEVIQAATRDNDFQPFHSLVDRLAMPYQFATEDQRYALPPEPDQVVHATFCGT